MEASSHVPLYSVVESTQRVYDSRLIVVSERTKKRHHHHLFSWDPATLQTLDRVEYATIHAVAPPHSRIITPLILTLFSQRLLDACKKRL